MSLSTEAASLSASHSPTVKAFGDPCRLQTHILAAVAGLLLLVVGQPAVAESTGGPFVVGVLYSSGQDFSRTFSVLEAAKAYASRVNAAGGVQGRKVIVTQLDYSRQAALPSRDFVGLIRASRVMALLGCVSEPVCKVTAAAAAELRIPLVAPMSGSKLLDRGANPYVFRLRADFATEADALAKQTIALGAQKVVIFSDGVSGSESDQTMFDALLKRGLSAELIRTEGLQVAGLEAAVKRLGAFHAAILNVGDSTLEALINSGLSERAELWPASLMVMSSSVRPALMRNFKGRVIGFSQVVPNPEVVSQPLARELMQDAERFADPAAISFEGMEAYLGMRLIVEALRISPKAEAQELANTLRGRASWSIGNLQYSFGSSRLTGSSGVEIGMRSRTGTLIN